ncbi:carbon-nitrogen hydrolase family protein [candidate division KSB1 bacterium]|nr:carbon-nitrogen hydrolase family protein [candidate division KSB1 bacterium]
MVSFNLPVIPSLLQTLFMLFAGLSLFLAGIAGAQSSESRQLAGSITPLRAAVGQFQLKPNIDANLKAIESMLEIAAHNDAELIVFPECALTGYPPPGRDSLDFINQDSTEKVLKYLRQRARDLSMAIALGAGWQDQQAIWRNRAFFIDDTGEILAYYDKIQQTDHERKFFRDGERLPTFSWRNLRLGMLICMDMRYPELWRIMRQSGVNLMLHLASAYGNSEWKVPVLEGTMRCRAAENGFYIVSCNNAGPVQMMVSGIYNPDGLMLARANYAVEEVIFSDMVIGAPEGFVDFKSDIYLLQKKSKE